ncbi:MAG: alanine--tRNA ligase [Phycisphaerae bacterium]
MTRSAAQIREDFLEFFRQRGHAIVPASPVIPYDDPTLLFTNAGMNQFKDVFLGAGRRSYTRCADTQPCIRAGGKHNDLDDVGRDTYHHTCFEMLGNWSFGDYFKRDAIAWAWELLTGVWGLEPARLHATYFGGDEKQGLAPDVESRDLWREITGLPERHVQPFGMKDNFWEMGETGPCGPCSEVHIDRTPDKSGAALVNAGDARVMEIWNLVFIQFNRNADGSLTPLPAKHVDTGMGFERIVSVVQGRDSNYDTDVFTPLFAAIRDATGAPPYSGKLPGATFEKSAMIDTSYRVIADHIRALCFAISDGCLPDKEGRGYVLRRILRRAVRYGWQYLGMHAPFLHRLVPAVAASLGAPFPHLKRDPAKLADVIREEEASFARTLDRGIALFDDAAQTAARDHHGEVQGADAFRLHDTFGFPIDLTEIMASERGLRVDIGEYERLMDQARERARGAGRAAAAYGELRGDLVTPFGATDDSPKHEQDVLSAELRGVVRFGADGAPVVLEGGAGLVTGAVAALVFDRTCFYAEQGGQVGDRGVILGPGSRFEIEATQRFDQTVAHLGLLVHGELRVGDRLELRVDARRAETRKNHTATHVMNWALRETLGEHVQQKGSLVDPDKTRFDFSHPKALGGDELAKIEALVGEQIHQNLSVHAAETPQADALKINGLRAVFGEKYPDVVRVVSIGAPVSELLKRPDDPRWRRFSIEFCGGTHVQATGEIGDFAVTHEEAVAKGVRRLVAITGDAARRARDEGDRALRDAEALLKGPTAGWSDGVAKLQAQLASATMTLTRRHRLREIVAELQERIKKQLKSSAAESIPVVRDAVEALVASAARLGEVAIVIGEIPDAPAEQLKHGADLVKSKCKSAALFFGVRQAPSEDNPAGKAILIAGVTEDLIKRGIKAGDWVKAIAPMVDGGGGGPPTLAQAGGKNPAKIDEALTAAREWILGRLA